LQSKVLRARERIEAEAKEAAEKEERAEALEKGWKPKVYK
jgi:import inner membrane translocase subunit TIM16